MLSLRNSLQIQRYKQARSRRMEEIYYADIKRKQEWLC